ncbi:hypothetical protein [Clostridium perfringens]|uniref:hypothetical protein n=1 Tax=Clostridium perfringens TaxID=1502 RepID=UPI0039E84148
MELSVFLSVALTAGAITISNITVSTINTRIYNKRLEEISKLMINILGNKNTSKEIKLQAIKVLKEIN